jgi:hypothetical protein
MNPREFCRQRGFNSTILLTYCFDPLFFERVILKDLGAGETGDILVLGDAREINESSKRWTGQLHDLGRRYQLALALTKGAFHPKVMLRVGSEGGAVWVGSGNLTSGGWGGGHEVCCAWTMGPGQDDDGGWLAGFLERIASWCPRGLQHNIFDRVLETPWVQASRRDADRSQLIVTGYNATSLSSQLEERWRGRRFEEVRIFTGSTDENGALLQWLNETFGITRAFIVLDENRASFIQERIESLSLDTTVMHLRGTQPVHAKFYWFEGPDGTAAVSGSANCSAAAWLLAPSIGGNVEAVSVYDQANSTEFESILEVFRSDELVPAKLSLSRTPSEKRPPGPTLSLSEVSWESSTGEFRITFTQVLASSARVTLELPGHVIQLLRAEETGRVWVTEVSELSHEQGTIFVDIVVVIGNAELRLRGWVNDLAELRHSSRGRRIVDAIGALGENLTSSEQQKALAQLQKIAVILLMEPASFPDPLLRRRIESGDKNDKDVESAPEPVDPEKLIRSIDTLDYGPFRVGETHRGGTLSLGGVMRAIFGGQKDFDEEIEIAEEPEDADDDGKEKYLQLQSRMAPVRVAAPEIRNKGRLSDQLRNYLHELAASEFATRCTATQLVNAAAFPLAVAFNGSTGGWVDDDRAEAWAVQVIDILFAHGPHRPGLLRKVRLRYREDQNEVDFLRIVGDGTLWLAILSALANIRWQGQNASLKKSLALRLLLQSSDLTASPDSGRVRQLLSRLEEEKALAVIQKAPRVVDSLRRIESVLLDELKALFDHQEKMRTSYEAGDLLWKPETVWAENRADAAWDENGDAYLHLRAAITKVKLKLFINVTKAAQWNERLAQSLVALDEIQ